MKVSEIMSIFRAETKDKAKPYFVDELMALGFLNQAQSEAARRARLLVDSESQEICRVQVSAGEPVVYIDPRIISIRRARLASSSRPLVKAKVRDMDDRFPSWDSSTNQSTPMIVVTDYGTNQLYLHAIPKADDELLLTVVREPLSDLKGDNDVPEIPARYHYGLIAWMKYRAYSIDDADRYDPKQAAVALGHFESEFGPRISATDEQYEFENYDDIGER